MHQKPTNLGLLDGVLDVVVCLCIGDGVTDANWMTLDEQPVVDDHLNVSIELSSLFVALLQVDDVK